MEQGQGEFSVLSLFEHRELEGIQGAEALEDIKEHLATYLLNNDLCDAKLLWKRTSEEHKLNPELRAIWDVGQALWNRDMPEFYSKAKAFQWSPRTQPIMERIIFSVQEKMVRLIGTAYVSIRPLDVASLLGITLEEVEDVRIRNEWNISTDGLIEPKEPTPEKVIIPSSEFQIGKLTDFVSFLEN